MATVTRLPTELLIEIFMHVKLGRRGLQWVAEITHICRHWREVSLCVPKLWTSFQGCRRGRAHRTALRLFLERSLNALVHIDTGDAVDDSIPTYVLSRTEHSRRIRSLFLDFLDPATVKRFTFPLENLETLQVRGCSQLRTDSESIAFSPVDNQFPRLRNLCLIDVAVPWYSSIFTNLVDIRLFDMRRRGYWTFRGFIDILDRCGTTMENLTMSRSAPILAASLVLEDMPPPPPIVSLPRIQTLHICDDSPYIRYLLGSLVVPSTAMIYITSIPRLSLVPLPHPNLPDHQHNIAILTEADTLSISIEDKTLRLAAGMTHSTRGGLLLDIKDRFKQGDILVDPIHIVELMPYFFGTSIRRLNLTGRMDCMHRIGWACTFSGLPSLRRLDVSSERSLLPLLEALNTRPACVYQTAVNLPHLKELRVETATMNQTISTECFAALFSRAASGFCLKTFELKVFHCGVPGCRYLTNEVRAMFATFCVSKKAVIVEEAPDEDYATSLSTPEVPEPLEAYGSVGWLEDKSSSGFLWDY